jgi:hypothetical protein
MISLRADLRLLLFALFAVGMYVLLGFELMVVAVIIVILLGLVTPSGGSSSWLMPALAPSFRPYVNSITTEHLHRPDPLPPAPHARRTIKYEDAMAPVRNDGRIDHHARHMELMAVPRDPMGGNASDFETNKRWVDATNKDINDARMRVRPDQYVVYDDDETSAPLQTLPVPFTPPSMTNTALSDYDHASSRKWATGLLAGMPGITSDW